MNLRLTAIACRQLRALTGLAALGGLLLLAGCSSLQEPREHYIGKASLNYYVGRATTTAAPAMTTQADESVATLPPHTIADRAHDQVRDISLAEAIHLSLTNSEIIRDRGQFLSPSNSLLNNPEFASSIYDPAIQETNTSFGNRGVEAALADFDATFTSQMLWGREEQVQNSLFGFGQQPGQTLQQDTARFLARIEKPFVTGSTFAVSHNVDYGFNNASNRLFDSVYQGNIQAEFRHPLLSGSGIEFNRIVGPQSRTQGRGAQFTNGVLIARINSDIAIAEFQRAARNLVREVEETYWNLYLAYRAYHAEAVARDSTLQTWRSVQARFEQGLLGGSAPELAQAEDSYLESRARAESAQADLYRRELELRRITGLPVNDGTILRPTEDPTTTEFIPDWYTSLCEALTSRTELRRQKWQIKSLQLQLVAAKNFARPSLDFVSRYRVNGFGDKLLAGDDDDVANTVQGLDGFYGNITEGDQTGWDLGIEFTMPIGLRAAKSQVRWYELRLAKARAALGTMEHEISLELAAAFQDLDRFYKTAETNLNRRAAAEERVRAYQTKLDLGLASENRTAYLDLLLRSQISLAQAEVAYWQSITSYNQAIADIYLREGTLLERNGISLSEGTWDPRAYQQALREAWARSHAIKNPLLDAVPGPFARPGETMPTAIPKLNPPAVIPIPDTLPPPALVPPAPADPTKPESDPEPIPEVETPQDPADDIPAVLLPPNTAPDVPPPAEIETAGTDFPGPTPELPTLTANSEPTTQTSGWKSTAPVKEDAIQPPEPGTIRVIQGVNR